MTQHQEASHQSSAIDLPTNTRIVNDNKIASNKTRPQFCKIHKRKHQDNANERQSSIEIKKSLPINKENIKQTINEETKYSTITRNKINRLQQQQVSKQQLKRHNNIKRQIDETKCKKFHYGDNGFQLESFGNLNRWLSSPDIQTYKDLPKANGKKTNLIGSHSHKNILSSVNNRLNLQEKRRKTTNDEFDANKTKNLTDTQIHRANLYDDNMYDASCLASATALGNSKQRKRANRLFVSSNENYKNKRRQLNNHWPATSHGHNGGLVNTIKNNYDDYNDGTQPTELKRSSKKIKIASQLYFLLHLSLSVCLILQQRSSAIVPSFCSHKTSNVDDEQRDSLVQSMPQTTIASGNRESLSDSSSFLNLKPSSLSNSNTSTDYYEQSTNEPNNIYAHFGLLTELVGPYHAKHALVYLTAYLLASSVIALIVLLVSNLRNNSSSNKSKSQYKYLAADKKSRLSIKNGLAKQQVKSSLKQTEENLNCSSKLG